MKKVLSVLLAAAMVMGMSVSAAAVDYSAPATGTGADVCADNITWKNAVLVDANGNQKEWIVPGSEEEGVKVDFGTMVEGDAIYFEIVDENDKMIGVIDFAFSGTGNPNMDVARMVSRPAPKEFEDAFLSYFDNAKEISRMKEAWHHIDNGYAEHIRKCFPEINLNQL